MKKIIKNQPTRIEFGDYDNVATMIPIDILEYRPNEYYQFVIRWQYPNSGNTIDLCHRGIDDVDFESFGCDKIAFKKEV